MSNQTARRLLLVEDSVSFSFAIKAKIERETGLEIVLARSLAEAEQAIEIFKGDFFLGLLDLTLPDASGDEIVHVAMQHKIPSVVFTGTYSDEMRDKLFSLGAIDYVSKDNPHSLNYIASLVRRLKENANWLALVVDDSPSSRIPVVSLLKKYRFQVLEADSGREALALLERRPNVRLVITDFNMPEMNGHELTVAIRQKYRPDRLAVIGLSGQDAAPLTAKFLKCGANDFLNKTFLREEFFCRVTQNMDYLDHVQALTEAATRDALTGLHNRRHFFDVAGALTAQTQRDGGVSALGMVDIDFFKKINDTYGHMVGDLALKHVAALIEGSFHRGGDVIARFGGEEFCIFLHNTDEPTAHLLLERVRAKIETSPLVTDEQSIPITASIGICASEHLPLSDLIGVADHALYAAKEEGRNRVVVAEDGGLQYFNDGGAIARVG